ncbi:hypothetical protein OSB04_024174 [Centaurea solstitialis]|uniref:Mitochondrial protein n=1 Tax=Centaurea solstitialis TaxID=347529 RepID=A0AA38T427_9ASTR|nr:hypothetical protein OSB04_024174 [Centaurea solstitialis]
MPCSAMQEELSKFIRNNVWFLMPRHRKRTIIGSKWIFINKFDEIGVVVNKARLMRQPTNFGSQVSDS